MVNYEISGNTIIIPETEEFEPRQILDCGQIFRYKESGGAFEIFADNQYSCVTKELNYVKIETDNIGYFVEYFDLNNDYTLIKDKVADSDFMKKAVAFGHGIRILRQSPLEMIFEFIISANNHIPRIKGIIERICGDLGKDMGGYKAFPTIEALAGVNADYYAKIGAGYRAAYLADTAKAIYNGVFDLNLPENTESALKELLKLKGIGPKVADCILLFGYHRTDVFPVDTWICQAYEAEYGKVPIKAIRRNLVERFGNLSGYAQQYMFYYKREHRNKIT